MQGDDKLESSAADPVWAGVPMPLQRMYFPLGFPLHVATNSSLILDAATESWPASWKQRFTVDPIRITLGVSVSDSASPGPPVCRARDHLLSMISDADNFLITDPRSRYAFGWVARATAQDRSFLRYYFLEAAALSLIEQLHLAPVHAATVVKDGTGILLCGDTGAGKSTLAYACARSGWSYVSDDASYLLRSSRTPCVIGNCRSLRLRADAPTLFRELLALKAWKRVNGKIGLELETDALPQPIQTQPEGVITDVVFLHRSSAYAASPIIEPVVDRDRERVHRRVWYGDDHVRENQRATYEQLLQTRWWELRYADCRQALDSLNRLCETATCIGTVSRG